MSAFPNGIIDYGTLCMYNKIIIILFRDRVFVTTFRSPKYCGHISKGGTKHLPNGSTAYTGGQRSRMYVEERDSEMDLFIYMSKRQLTTRPRYLRLTVTVIKKNCASNNLFYRSFLMRLTYHFFDQKQIIITDCILNFVCT